MAETWVRWWRNDDFPGAGDWSKWHHVTDRRPSGPTRVQVTDDGNVRASAEVLEGPAEAWLRCQPYGFRIPDDAEYRDDRPPEADACKPCTARLIRRPAGDSP